MERKNSKYALNYIVYNSLYYNKIKYIKKIYDIIIDMDINSAKKYAITYGSRNYKRQRLRVASELKTLDIFDEITPFSTLDLDNTFREKYKDILEEKRGGGFWIWKYQIIQQTLEKMKDGDFLVYLDSGCKVNPKGKDRMNEYFEMLHKSEYGMISFQMSQHLEYKWTTSSIFNYFNIKKDSNIANSGQYHATVIIMQKKPHLYKWLNDAFKCLHDDRNLFTNKYNNIAKNMGFCDNRHDQSVSSVLRKIHGSIILEDETLSHLKDSPKWPIWAKRLKD